MVPEMDYGTSLMDNNKALGKSGIPAEALKALPPLACEVLHHMICQFWKGERANYDEWQTALLKMLYKGKGDAKDPTNYQGIVLQDIFACLMSIIVANRLKVLLQKCGIEEQFGSQSHRGTIDVLFCICLALQLHKEHCLDTYVLFVDLIKAFDTADHELLFLLLAHYGAPPMHIDVI